MDAESQYFLKSAAINTTPLKLVQANNRKVPASIPKGLTLKEFIEWYLIKGWGLYATVDAHTNGEKTPVGRYRTLGDIFRVCYNYYPEATLIEVRRHVLKHYIVGHKCDDIHRRIYVSSKAMPGWQQRSIGKHDEFGFKIYYYIPHSGKKRTQQFDGLFY